jgi:hypothetical protein
MSADIIPLPGRGPTSPVAHYVRVGEQAHVQLEELHSQGRFPVKRAVIDASRFKHQRKLFDLLRSEGLELVLDTKAAELAEPAKRSGFARGAPWAPAEDVRPMGPKFFGDTPHSVIQQIAQFAVENNFSAVLAPTHFLRQGPNDDWFKVDLAAVSLLRKYLDQFGGKKVAIDYTLIMPQILLRDDAARGALVEGLSRISFENLWIRASGFGSDGTASGARAYINALCALHNLGRPIISDYLGGLIGLAAVAFGAASGIAHGIGERERFDAGSWHLEPKKKDDDEKGKGGRQNRIYVASMDRSLTVPELNALAKARGGRRLLVCGDRDCCSGLDDMINNWRGHFLKQRFEQIQRIENVPDLKREDDFLNRDLALADQQSRQIMQLNPVETELVPMADQTAAEAKEKLIQRLTKHARRDEKLRATLENLHETRGTNAPRARSTRYRGATIEGNSNSQEKK